MGKVNLGQKRKCQRCQKPFYDMNKDPIICPACGHQYLLNHSLAIAPPPSSHDVSSADDLVVDPSDAFLEDDHLDDGDSELDGMVKLDRDEI